MSVPKMQSEPISIQGRDLALLRELFECRVMTAAHVAALYFNGKIEATKKRLQKIKAAVLIGERPRRAFEPSVLFLTRKGLELLQAQGVLTEYPKFDLPILDRRARVSDLTIRHELEVMDVKAAFHKAIGKGANLSIAEFSTWPLLNQFTADGRGKSDILVKPDGFIRIHETDAQGKFEHSFFVEVDRSTEAQDILVGRAGFYLDYYRSGGFAVRNGGNRSDFKEFPFRVLMIFKTEERMNNTAERLLLGNPPILTQVSLSTIEATISEPLGKIWFRPIEYRNAVKGTPFDIGSQPRQFGYKRQTSRELFIREHIKKIRLFDDESE